MTTPEGCPTEEPYPELERVIAETNRAIREAFKWGRKIAAAPPTEPCEGWPSEEELARRLYEGELSYRKGFNEAIEAAAQIAAGCDHGDDTYPTDRLAREIAKAIRALKTSNHSLTEVTPKP